MFDMENQSFGRQNAVPPRVAVPAVGKAVRVLDQVAADGRLGISELARRAGFGKSTVHGLVAALTEEGMLAVDGRGYRLGPHLLELAARAWDHSLLGAAQSALNAFGSESGETAFFGRLESNRVTILAKRDSPRPLSLSSPIGTSMPVLAGALGPAYLATLSSDEARRYLDGHALPRHTERSIVEVDAYLEAAEEARQAGYALDRGQYLPGVVAAATAFTAFGATYVVWAVGIERENDGPALEALGNAVERAAAAIHRHGVEAER